MFDHHRDTKLPQEHPVKSRTGGRIFCRMMIRWWLDGGVDFFPEVSDRKRSGKSGKEVRRFGRNGMDHNAVPKPIGSVDLGDNESLPRRDLTRWSPPIP